jgi:hypothetical protein
MWRWSVGGFLGKRDCSSRTKTTVLVARAPRSRTAHADFGAVQTFLVLENPCGGVGEVDMKMEVAVEASQRARELVLCC